MSPKPNVTEERTAQIIEAAINVFAREGFYKARMDDIAKETGVSKGTLYLYFKSKDAIIGKILEAIISREIARAREVLETAETTEYKIRFISDLVCKDIKKMKPLYPIYFEFLSIAARKKSVRELIKQVFGEFIDVLTPIIQEGIDSGEFRPVDPEEAAITFSALFEGMILIWAYDNEKVDLEKHLDSSINLLLEGLKQ